MSGAEIEKWVLEEIREYTDEEWRELYEKLRDLPNSKFPPLYCWQTNPSQDTWIKRRFVKAGAESDGEKP